MSYKVVNGKSHYVNSGRMGATPAPARAEVASAIRFWFERDLSDNAIALKVGVSSKTVLRHRHRIRLAAQGMGSA